jgi:hypothetical protein
MKKLLYSAALFIAIASIYACNKSGDSLGNKSLSNPGTRNGSLTRIVTVGNYLYVVDNSNLKTINATNPTSLVVTDSKPIGFQIQTIFYNNGQLYVGAANNLYVYSTANPAVPSFTSSIDYTPVIDGRDPVIAFDSVVYSTIIFGNNNGLLRVINNKTINMPVLRTTIPLSEPRGMDYVDSTLYVCNGNSGLALFNIKQPYNPVFIKAIDKTNTYNAITNSTASKYMDVLAIRPSMFCYINGGVVQYNIADARNPVYMNTVN